MHVAFKYSVSKISIHVVGILFGNDSVSSKSQEKPSHIYRFCSTVWLKSFKNNIQRQCRVKLFSKHNTIILNICHVHKITVHRASPTSHFDERASAVLIGISVTNITPFNSQFYTGTALQSTIIMHSPLVLIPCFLEYPAHFFFGEKCWPKIGMRGLFTRKHCWHCCLSLHVDLPTVLVDRSEGKSVTSTYKLCVPKHS